MSKLANKHRTGQRGDPILSQMAVYNPGGTVPPAQATYTPYGPGGGNGGGTPMDSGPCGYVGPATPMSWGAACPPGHCTSETLAKAIGREYAGERYPCRELTYWLALTSDGAGAVTSEQNSKVTICPTRVICSAAVDLGNGLLTIFEIGNQNQIVGDPLPVQFIHQASYVIIPLVTDCLRAGTPFKVAFTGLPATTFFNFGIIGPAIG